MYSSGSAGPLLKQHLSALPTEKQHDACEKCLQFEIYVTYLLEPDNVWMQQRAMVDELSLNILVNLQAGMGMSRRQPMQGHSSNLSSTLDFDKATAIQ